MSEILLVNPKRRGKKRKARRKSKKVYRRRRHAKASAPKRRRRYHKAVKHSRRRKRNPSLRSFTGSIMPTVKAGVVGALGALGLDVALGYGAAKLPAQLQSGYGLVAVKVLGAIGIGIAGGYLLKGKGGELAKGAMTVVLHDELKKVVAANFPTVPLGEYLSIAPTVGYPGIAYNPNDGGMNGIGQYMTGDASLGNYGEDDALAAGGAY